MFINQTGDAYDPTTYDPDAFYTLEAGAETIRSRVSTRLSRTINAIVQSGQFPHYQTSSDFIRNAVMHQIYRDSQRMTDPIHRHKVESEVEEMRKSQATMTLAEIMRRNQNEAKALLDVAGATNDLNILGNVKMRAKELVKDLIDEETRNKLEALIVTAKTDDPTGYPVDC